MCGDDRVEPGVARGPGKHEVNKTPRVRFDMGSARKGRLASGCKGALHQANSRAALDLKKEVQFSAEQICLQRQSNRHFLRKKGRCEARLSRR